MFHGLQPDINKGSKTENYHLGPVDILDWVNFCFREYSMHCRIVNSIPNFYLLNASDNFFSLAKEGHVSIVPNFVPLGGIFVHA